MHQLSFTFKRAHWSAVSYGLKVIAKVRGMTPSRFDLMHCIRLNEIDTRKAIKERRRLRARQALMPPRPTELTEPEPRRIAEARKAMMARAAADPEIGLAVARALRDVENDELAESARITQSSLRRHLGVSRATVSKMLTRLVEMRWVTRTRADEGDRRQNIIELTGKGRTMLLRACKILFGARAFMRTYEDITKRYFWPKTRCDHLERIAELWLATAHVAKSLGDTSTLEYYFGWKDHFG